MKIFVFGSSITSTYWNGAATYYRGIYKGLHNLGYHIIFAEPVAYNRQEHEDALGIDYAEVKRYVSPEDLPDLLRQAATAEIVIKHSGVGADDTLLEHRVLGCRSKGTKVLFWDVDAPATLARVAAKPHDYFRSLVSQYDAILTYGGGPVVVSRYLALGARSCTPIYNGLDPETHYPVAAIADLSCDLAFIGHRLPDRERRVDEFFFKTASLAPSMRFLLGGEGWSQKSLPANVRWIGHVSSDLHNVVNCSAKIVLNVNRESMAEIGFSPPTRVFEAAGAAACVVTDLWEGVEQFFFPDTEILCAQSAQQVANYLVSIDAARALAIGRAMRERALREHTYRLRAEAVHCAFQRLLSDTGSSQPDSSDAAYKIPA